MSLRILLAIGCNAYEHAPPLGGAELDARRVFDVLTRPEIGEYHPTRSRLLLSPSIDEARKALRDLLLNDEEIDTFTFFFAGHGGIKAGSFYLWLRDSRPEAQSMSALSLNDLFRSLNEAAPQQSNVILDACESGGLISDLGAILKAELLGDAGTPGITLLATSAQDQFASETDAGGRGTNAILDCVEGRVFVQDNSSALDLVEIGRQISTRLIEHGQSPVVWGLNLMGAPRFCRNPRFASDPAHPFRELIQSWPASIDSSIRTHHDSLWKAYASTDDRWDARAFANVLDEVLLSLKANPEALAGFAERLGAAVATRSRSSDDPFRPALVSATLAVSLLPYAASTVVASCMQRFVHSTSQSLIEAARTLVADLAQDKFALLAKRGGGLSELFYLPVRIAKLLGWLGATCWLLRGDDSQRHESAELFGSLVRSLLENYAGSLRVISDAQAAHFGVALACTNFLNLHDEAEQLAGLLFHSLISCRGQVARWDIPPDQALQYLIARHENDFVRVPELIERPIESLTVLMKAATLLGLEEVIDKGLWKLDGVAFSAYFTSDFAQYGAESMRGGDNLVWAVGADIHRVDEFRESCPATPVPANSLVEAVAILASLLYPDRVAWFCLEPHWHRSLNG